MSDFQHKILHFHSKKHLIEEQKRTYSFEFIYDIYKYFYFFNISNDSLFILINSLFPLKENIFPEYSYEYKLLNSKEFYNKVYDVVNKELTTAEKRKIYINFLKLNQQNLLNDFTNYSTSYNKINKSLEIKIQPSNGTLLVLGNSLSGLPILESLEVYSVEPVDVKGSFTNLTNLKEINFTSTFPKNLYSEIIKLKNLKTLKLKKPYNDEEKELVDKLRKNFQI